jgi:hypothetical protein
MSEALTMTNANYSEIEKIIYVVVMASRKLRHYFQAHNIIVPSSHLLRDVLRNREASGRIGKWAVEPSEFAIDFIHRTTIQSQALVDFVVDWTPASEGVQLPAESEVWQVHCDGSWTVSGAGAAAIIRSPSGTSSAFAVRLQFPSTTNNVAEYEAVMLGLRKLKALGVRRAVLMSDSQVISKHIR